MTGVTCPSVSGYSLTVGADHVGDDISCLNDNDINAAVSDCNNDQSCKSFVLVFNSWKGRCIKRTDTITSSNENVCFYKRTYSGTETSGNAT
jgi:hypothetical protein